MIPVSACLNCRDDEVTIRRWLDLFAPRVAEVVICDTGSQDETLKIIETSGYDNISLHQTDWPGFITARNRFFDWVGQPYILQVDADEFLLAEFFHKLPHFLALLEAQCDSIRLPHYMARFDYTSLEVAEQRWQTDNASYQKWSYPRDVLYRADLADLGRPWVASGGAEILNNLNTDRVFQPDDPLIHCIPAHHKLNNDEYHARKMLAYAMDLGRMEPEWQAFLQLFSEEQVQRMQDETAADPTDPAPHATWWGQTGRLLNQAANTDWIERHWVGYTSGYPLAEQLSRDRSISLTEACREINAFQAKRAPGEGDVAALIEQFLPEPPECIVVLGAGQFGDLGKLFAHYPSSLVIGVDRFDNGVNEDVTALFQQHSNRSLLVEADERLAGLGWHDLNITKNLSAIIVCPTAGDAITAWQEHLSQGGVIVFTERHTSRQPIQNLPAARCSRWGRQFSWVKTAKPEKPPDDGLEKFKRDLTGSDRLPGNITLPELADHFTGRHYNEKLLAGDSMAGRIRLEALQYCVERIIADDIPGDFVETGTWRGGCSILMRYLLACAEDTNRWVWVADSFEGLPPPDVEKYPADEGLHLNEYDYLAVDLETVKDNFARRGLLDDRVLFLKGWFKDTLPTAPIDKIALLRLDGDLYESTMDALVSLYPKVVRGGYIFIDDYGALAACRQAVTDYCESKSVSVNLTKVDWTGYYWQKT